MSGILQVFYTCEQCGASDRKLTVPHRKEGEDIRGWMDQVIARIANDHRIQSPFCKAATMTNAKIPLEEDKGIGH
jgi:hypothetical protein